MSILEQTKKDILSVYYGVTWTLDAKPRQELEDMRHKADEIRNNPKHPWSERTAAEMIYVAASEKLGI